MSVSFEFYKTIYGGNLIPESDWVNYEAHASAQLIRYKDIYTVSSYTSDEAESMAVCAMAETLYTQDGQLSVKSASIGSVSVTYGEADAKAQAKELFKAAQRFLCIYRGIG